MKLRSCIQPLVALSLLFAGGGLSLLAQDEVVFVENGVLLDATTVGPGVEQHEDYILVQGTTTGLGTNVTLMDGDFHISATLAFDINGTAAGFVFGFHGNSGNFMANPTGFFGFDGGSQTLFVEQGFMNAAEGSGPATEGAAAADFIENSVPFLFEAKREGEILTVLIDEVMVYTQNIGTQAIGVLGIRPWRANMHVYDFRATGNFAGITLPTKTNFGEYKTFVENGDVQDVNLIGDGWEKVDNYIAAQGTAKYLETIVRVLEGDFHLEAEMSMDMLDGTAASFRFGTNDFGFDGGRRTFFQGGALYAPGVEFGPAAAGFPAGDYIVGGEPFLLEAKRVEGVLTVMIDGEGIYQKEIGSDGIGLLAFRPWRSEMRVYNFRVAGNLEAPASIPTVDQFGEVRYISFLGGLMGGNYVLGEIGAGIAPYIDDGLEDLVVSMPSILEGNLGIRTRNAQSGWGSALPADAPVGFVTEGNAVNMHIVGTAWSQGEGYLYKQGTGNSLLTDSMLMGGDFHIEATLEVDAINGTASGFHLGNAYFGFDGGGQSIFTQGGFFGGTTTVGQSADHIEAGVPFLFEVIRVGDQLTVLLDGEQVHQQELSTDTIIGSVGPRPWRSEMKIYDLQVTGNQGWTNYLAFEVDRATTVYIANDPAFEADWLTERFNQTDMTIETTSGMFDVWERAFDARDFVMLPGNGGTGQNYWVILSEKPSVITPSPTHYVRTPGGADWTLARNNWQLTTDPEAALHSGNLLTPISNFDPVSGLRISGDFRVPQLQHEGANSYGFLMMGDSTISPNQGIRAEWLPRQADGTSILRLVNNATGGVLTGENASVSWGGNVPVRTNDWVIGDEQMELMWDPRASELASTYFKEDDSKVIVRLPDGLDPGFLADGIKTENDLSNTSDTFLQFTVESGDALDGNDGVTVFVAWDIRNSGYEPSWLTEGFTKTDHLVQVNSAALYHRLWAAEFGEGATVTLPGASAGGGGPFVKGTDNYFVLLGDTRSGLDSVFNLEAEAIRVDGVWTVSATLTDADGYSETVSGTHTAALDGQNVFGVSVRHLDRTDLEQTAVTPIWETFSLAMDFVNPPVLTGFAAWAAEKFPDDQNNPLISGPDAAPAGDGVMNLIKYALGLEPLIPATSEDLPQASLNEEGDLVLVYWERTDADDVSYLPEVSNDLNTWRSGSEHLLEIFRDSDGGDFEEVGVRAILLEDTDRAFIRLKIDQID